MNRDGGKAAPRTLSDISHLFLSRTPPGDASAGPKPAGLSPTAKLSCCGDAIDLASVKAWLSARGAALVPGGRLVASGFEDPGGTEVILADAGGNPVFVEVLDSDPAAVPFLMLSRGEWLRRRSAIFLRAFEGGGVRATSDPLFVFIAPCFPEQVVRAVEALAPARAALYEARAVRLEGMEGALLRPVHPAEDRRHPAVFAPRRPAL